MPSARAPRRRSPSRGRLSPRSPRPALPSSPLPLGHGSSSTQPQGADDEEGYASLPFALAPPPQPRQPISLPPEPRSCRRVLLRDLVRAYAEQYDEVKCPAVAQDALRASEQLSEHRYLTVFEEALFVLGGLVIPATAPGQALLSTQQAFVLRACFANEEHRLSTQRRWVEPERDRMMISLGTLLTVLQRIRQSALAVRLQELCDSLEASIEQTTKWPRASFDLYDLQLLFTLPGADVARLCTHNYRASGLDKRGNTVKDAAPHQPEAGSRRAAQDLHIDHPAHRVAETYQLAVRTGRALVPPTSFLVPLDPGLPRSVHLLPYKVLPGHPAEAMRTRCSAATFNDVLGTPRAAVTSTVEVRAGEAMLFTGMHAGGAQEAESAGRLALFGRLRSSAWANEPDASQLYRCHTADVGVEVDRPHRLSPAFGVPVHAPVQVPRFDADGRLPWRPDRHNGDVLVWRPVCLSPLATLIRPHSQAKPLLPSLYVADVRVA